jgi:hypothetical protein
VILGVAQGLILLRIVSKASKDCFKKYGLVLGGLRAQNISAFLEAP